MAIYMSFFYEWRFFVLFYFSSNPELYARDFEKFVSLFKQNAHTHLNNNVIEIILITIIGNYRPYAVQNILFC